MEQAFYKDRLADSFNLDVLVPDKYQRDIVHSIIYEELVQGIVSAKSRAKYVDVIKDLVGRGAQ